MYPNIKAGEFARSVGLNANDYKALRRAVNKYINAVEANDCAMGAAQKHEDTAKTELLTLASKLGFANVEFGNSHHEDNKHSIPITFTKDGASKEFLQ